jgi:hypothetical protein
VDEVLTGDGAIAEKLYSGNRESLEKSLLDGDSILPRVIATLESPQNSLAQLRASNVFNHLRWVEFRNSRQAPKSFCHGHTMPSR